MGFKYTVVADTLAFLGYDLNENPREILEAVKAAGYDGVDVAGDRERIQSGELRKITDSLELEIPEVLGAWAYYHSGENRDLAGGDAEVRSRGIQYAKDSIELAVELGAQFFEVCAAQPPIPQIPFPDLSIKTLRSNFLEALKEICGYAEKRNIEVLFEPLNCYEGYPGVLTTLYEATNLIRDLGYANTGIQPDVFHMNISEGSIPDALREAGTLVKHFHMNETNRYSYGTGHGDHRAIIRTLKEIGFTGFIAIYLPLISQEVCRLGGYITSASAAGGEIANKPDLNLILERQLQYLKQIESQVELQWATYEKDSSYLES